ncbi:MAG: secretin N-terminal domain-containing protein, partial [Candidatus Omnitrophota bacterium]
MKDRKSEVGGRRSKDRCRKADAGGRRAEMRLFFCLLFFVFCPLFFPVFAQDEPDAGTAAGDVMEEGDAAGKEEVAVAADTPNVTLDFKDADIRNVLRIISLKSGVNIVSGPEVAGLVTIRLDNVPWNEALDTIVKTYGFGYVKKGSIIIVDLLEKLAEQQKLEAEFSQTQSIETRVFNLKYLDASDVAATLSSLLSERGKITVLQSTGQSGWQFGTMDDQSKRERIKQGQISRSKVLLVTDVRPVLDSIEQVLEEIDVMPKQILIDARIMEVNQDRLRDLGLDWATGSSGAESSTISLVDAAKNNAGEATAKFGGHVLGNQTSPSVFGAKATGIAATDPFNTGMEFLYKKLTGTQFEVIMHALEEDVNTNTLSAPRILTLNNQEAAILVGTKYPFLKG